MKSSRRRITSKQYNGEYMKTLEEYLDSKAIEESKYDFIDREFIDYFNEKWAIQHAQSYDDLKYEIYESKTIYDGQEEQADVIDKEFKQRKGNDTIIIDSSKFKGIENVCFSKLHLYVKLVDKDEHGEYKYNDKKYQDYNEIRWNPVTEKFNFVEITVFVKNTTTSIKDIVLHELKHYWDDFNGFKHHKTKLSDAALKTKYKRFNVMKDDDDFVATVKQINNMFTKVEQGAYISQIVGNIGSILKQKKWHSIDEAIKELVKSEEYIRYKKLKEFVMLVLADEQMQSRYVEAYKNITNTTLSDTKIVIQLDNKFNKFWSELQKAIYKYIEEHNLVKESSLSIDYREFIR